MEPFLQITTGPGGEGIAAASTERLITFFLVFVRCASLVASAPVISSRVVPRPVKGLVALGTAVVVEASLPSQSYRFSGLVDFILLVAGEALIGLMMGFVGQILFQSVTLAGVMMGQQAGFAIVTALDPTTEEDAALVSQILMLMATLVFLVSNGHQVLLRTLGETFRLIPPGSLASLTALGEASREVVRPMGGAHGMPGFFEFGMKISGPVIVALIATTLAEAVIAKTVPQVNIMILGFGIRILLGLFVMILSFPMVCYLIQGYLMLYPNWIHTVISWLGGTGGP